MTYSPIEKKDCCSSITIYVNFKSKKNFFISLSLDGVSKMFPLLTRFQNLFLLLISDKNHTNKRRESRLDIPDTNRTLKAALTCN